MNDITKRVFDRECRAFYIEQMREHLMTAQMWRQPGKDFHASEAQREAWALEEEDHADYLRAGLLALGFAEPTEEELKI